MENIWENLKKVEIKYGKVHFAFFRNFTLCGCLYGFIYPIKILDENEGVTCKHCLKMFKEKRLPTVYEVLMMSKK